MQKIPAGRLISRTPVMYGRAISVLLMGVIGAVLLTVSVLWTSSQPAFAEVDSPLKLTINASKPSYQPGEPVTLRVEVTNHTGVACDLVAAAEGTLEVVSASRDVAAIFPSFTRTSFNDGVRAVIKKSIRHVTSRDKVSFTVTVPPRRGLAILTPLPDNTALAALWPLDASGQYELHLAYRVTPLASVQACAGASNVASVSIAVHAGAGRGWLLTAGIAAAVLLVAATAVILVRRRRLRHWPAIPIVLAALVSSAVIIVGQQPARGNVDLEVVPLFLADGDASPDAIRAQFNACMSEIYLFDRPLIDKLTKPDSPNIVVYNSIGSSSYEGDRQTGGRRSGVILWDNFDTSLFEGDQSGAQRDPCATLYHELVHAGIGAGGQSSDYLCDTRSPWKPLPRYDEVRATIAENRFRSAHHLTLRTTYGGYSIPSSAEECFRIRDLRIEVELDERPKRPAVVTGDPHLVTFDGYLYDFQAVGEFVAARSTVDDLEIQVRQEPLPDSRTVAVDSAVALRAKSNRLGFYLVDGTISVHRNGDAVKASTEETVLPDGMKLFHRTNAFLGESYEVKWPDGTRLWVRSLGRWGLHLEVAPASERKGTFAGLLGDYDGNSANDMATSGNERLVHPLQFEQLYPGYADSWRVTGAASLFDYPTGKGTEDFTDRTFPDRPTTVADLPTGQRDTAAAACRMLKVTDPGLLDACILDVALTGQATFALTAGITQRIIADTTATFTNVSWQRTPPNLTYHIDIAFTGLHGKSCLIKWQTVFRDTRAFGHTHGEFRTGVLSSDEAKWSIDNLSIPEPSPSRRWGTIFEVYCPDDVLLATRHPEYD